MSAGHCGLPHVNHEMQHFKVGDLVTFHNETLYLVIATNAPERYRVELTLLDLMFERGVTKYGQSPHWLLGKVTP